MSSTLLVGDQIIVNKLYPLLGNPARGDIIVFDSPLEAGSDLVKRVVGLPGEQVELRGHVLYINGEAVAEPYAQYRMTDHWSPLANHFGPITIPAKTVLVLGDNRDNSTDSRYFGPVPLETVKGKAVLRHWSWSGEGFGVRWDRVGESL
jgi:signal peptidase I